MPSSSATATRQPLDGHRSGRLESHQQARSVTRTGLLALAFAADLHVLAASAWICASRSGAASSSSSRRAASFASRRAIRRMIRSRIASTLGVGRNRQHLEPQPGAVLGEHAVGHDKMEMDVEVHQPAEPLHEGHRPGQRRTEPARARHAPLHAPIARTTRLPTQLVHAGSRASTRRSGLGTVNTHCR